MDEWDRKKVEELAMGWLKERADLRRMGSYAAIAKRMMSKRPGKMSAPTPPKAEVLANNLGHLDKGRMVSWWMEDARTQHRRALADVLDMNIEELESKLSDQIQSEEDPGRWFTFKVFPRLRPLDMDHEDPYPGIPELLVEGDGPTGKIWWWAPTGAGRTLVGRWLARRHQWVQGGTDYNSPLFLESESLPGQIRSARVVLASPKAMPAELLAKGWVELRTPKDWGEALLAWVAERVDPGGHYDPARALKLWKTGKMASFVTPGQLLEALAMLDQGGAEALEGNQDPTTSLHRWVQVHVGRKEKLLAPASRAFLMDHGAWLLGEAELERRRRGVSLGENELLSCFPTLVPAPDADTVLRMLEREGEEGVRQVVRPQAEAIVGAMRALQWFADGEWAFPTLVQRWLRAMVVEKVTGKPPGELGALLEQGELMPELIGALAKPNRLEAALSGLATAEVEAPETALYADLLLKAAVLRWAERGQHPSLEPLWELRDRIVVRERNWPLPVDSRSTGIGEHIWSILGQLLRGPPLPWMLSRLEDGLVSGSADPEGPFGRTLRRLAIRLVSEGEKEAGREGRQGYLCLTLRRIAAGEVPSQFELQGLVTVGPEERFQDLCAQEGLKAEEILPLLWRHWLPLSLDSARNDVVARISDTFLLELAISTERAWWGRWAWEQLWRRAVAIGQVEGQLREGGASLGWLLDTAPDAEPVLRILGDMPVIACRPQVLRWLEGQLAQGGQRREAYRQWRRWQGEVGAA